MESNDLGLLILIPILLCFSLAAKTFVAVWIAQYFRKHIFFAVYVDGDFVDGSFCENESRSIHDEQLTIVNGYRDVSMKRIVCA